MKKQHLPSEHRDVLLHRRDPTRAEVLERLKRRVEIGASVGCTCRRVWQRPPRGRTHGTALPGTQHALTIHRCVCVRAFADRGRVQTTSTPTKRRRRSAKSLTRWRKVTTAPLRPTVPAPAPARARGPLPLPVQVPMPHPTTKTPALGQGLATAQTRAATDSVHVTAAAQRCGDMRHVWLAQPVQASRVDGLRQLALRVLTIARSCRARAVQQQPDLQRERCPCTVRVPNTWPRP